MFSLRGMVAPRDLHWNPLFSRQMICIGKTHGWRWCVVHKSNLEIRTRHIGSVIQYISGLCICWEIFRYSYYYQLPPTNEVWGKRIFSQACVSHCVHRGRGSLSGGVSLTETPRTEVPPPDRDPYGHYASYWNAFLLLLFWVNNL